MSVSECVKFEQKLAYFMAPSLLGIKCASLMSINKTEFSVLEHLERFNARAHAKGLKLRLLCDCTNRALILLYQETLLQQQLQNSQVQFTAAGICRTCQSGGSVAAAFRTHPLFRGISPRNRRISGLSCGRCDWVHGKQRQKLRALQILEGISPRRTGKAYF